MEFEAKSERISGCQEENRRFLPESRYDILRIHPSKLRLIWDRTYPLLVKSMIANPNLKMQDIIIGLADQSIQCWVVIRAEGAENTISAAFLTSIERDNGEWVLSLFNLGGAGAKDWVMDVHNAMHRFARIQGCRRVRMCGRPAWQRILPDYPVVGELGGHLIYERPVED